MQKGGSFLASALRFLFLTGTLLRPDQTHLIFGMWTCQSAQKGWRWARLYKPNVRLLNNDDTVDEASHPIFPAFSKAI